MDSVCQTDVCNLGCSPELEIINTVLENISPATRRGLRMEQKQAPKKYRILLVGKMHQQPFFYVNLKSALGKNIDGNSRLAVHHLLLA